MAIVIVTINTMLVAFLLCVLLKSLVAHLKVPSNSENHAPEESASWWVLLNVYVGSKMRKWTGARR